MMSTALLNEKQKERKHPRSKSQYLAMSPAKQKAYSERINRKAKEKRALTRAKRALEEAEIDAKIADLKKKPIEDLIYNERTYR